MVIARAARPALVGVGAVLVAASLDAACGAFLGDTASVGDGAPPDSSSDAPGDDGGAASTDGRSQADARTSEGGDAADADAAPSSPGFCATQAPDAAFCADFDEPDAAGIPPWDTSAGVFSVTGSHAHSPPFSLSAQAPSGTVKGSYLQKTFTVTSSIEVRAAVLFTSLPSGGGRLCPLYIDSTNGPALNFYVSDSGSYFQSGNNIYSDTINTALTLDAWHEVDFTIDVTTSPAQVKTFLDGAPVAWSNNGNADATYAAPANVQIFVGASHSYMLPSTFPAYVDDVRVYVK
jgi:hypothetical protein